MLHHFEKTPLAVDGCYTYKAIRNDNPNSSTEHGDMFQYFDCSKNLTYPAMQQVNVSRSKKNVIRGIHISAFPKVVFCPVGKIYDVCVDCRPNSPTFKKWCGAWLDKDTHIFVPPFCAHGVFSAEDDSALCYYQMGTFWPHLDYAISYRDPQFGVKWPAPIDADEYLLSEKDKNSSPLNDELIEKIRKRIENPINDYHTVTNTDIIVCSPDELHSLPIFEGIEALGLKGHLTMLNALQRDSLNAAIKSLRPKHGIIYILDKKQGQTTYEIFREIMNIIHIAVSYQDHLAILLGTSNIDGIETLEKTIREEYSSQVILLKGQCILQKGMTKLDVAQKLIEYEHDFKMSPTYTDLDTMGPQIVKMVVEKVAGIYPFVAKGEMDLTMAENICKEVGLQFHHISHTQKLDAPFEMPDAGDAFLSVVQGAV